MTSTRSSQVARRHLAAILAFAASVPTLADTTFQPAGPLGQWFDAANWSNGIPGTGGTTFVGDSKIAVVKGAAASGGSLKVGFEDGKFGTVEIADVLGTSLGVVTLELGAVKNSTGRLLLTGGSYNGGAYTQIGTFGVGIFRQLKGESKHTVLNVGAGLADGEGDGTFQMLGGTCTTNTLEISRFAVSPGLFEHSNGDVIVNGLRFSIYSVKSAAYNMSGGTLTVTPDAIVAPTHNGTFQQTGGTATFKGAFYNGGSKAQDGTLSGIGKASLTIKTGAASTSIAGTLYNFKNATINIQAKSTVTVPLVDNSRGGTMNIDGVFNDANGAKSKLVNAGLGRINIQDEFGGIGVCAIDGDFTQTDGILGIHVVGFNAGQFSALRGTGLASLGGILEVDFLPGVSIEIFKLIKIVDFEGGAVSGNFDSIILPGLDPGYSWVVQQGSDYVGIEVVPAPASAGALAAGLIFAARRRRG